jgi:hypothetical protein
VLRGEVGVLMGACSIAMRSALAFDLLRAALTKKAERVSPRAAAASSIAASRPASSERFALAGRPESRTSGTIASAAPSASAAIISGSVRRASTRARLRQFLTVRERVFSPQPHSLARLAQDLIGGGSGGRAAWQIWHSHPAVHECHIASHRNLHSLEPSGLPQKMPVD